MHINSFNDSQPCIKKHERTQLLIFTGHTLPQITLFVCGNNIFASKKKIASCPVVMEDVKSTILGLYWLNSLIFWIWGKYFWFLLYYFDIRC
jgi:hypothetical protein